LAQAILAQAVGLGASTQRASPAQRLRGSRGPAMADSSAPAAARGSAWRRRQQADRATARKLEWVRKLSVAAAVHHASPARARQRPSLELLEAAVRQLQAELAAVKGALDCLRGGPSGGPGPAVPPPPAARRRGAATEPKEEVEEVEDTPAAEAAEEAGPTAEEETGSERSLPGAGAKRGVVGQAAVHRGGFHGAVSVATGTVTAMLPITDPQEGLRYAHIGAMDCYRNKSFEELRMEDYLAFRVHGCRLEAFAGGGQGPRSREPSPTHLRTEPAAAGGAAAPAGDLPAQTPAASQPTPGSPWGQLPPRRGPRAGRAASGSAERPRRRARTKGPPS